MMPPLHIVQIGYDDSVFILDAPSDTRVRQILYARLLDEKRPGSRMTVIMFTDRRDARPFRDGSVDFIPLMGRGVWRGLGLFRVLKVISVEQKIDLLTTQTIFADAWLALMAARWLRANVVGQIHFDIFSAPAQAENLGGAFHARWRMMLALRLLRHLRAVRVTAQRVRADLITRRLHSNIAVLPVPVTMPVVLCDPAPESRRVLFVGRLVAAKDLARWLRVAQRIYQQEPEVEFEWAGDGPLRAGLLAEADRLGIGGQMRWRGAVPYTQLPDVYAQAAVFLLTSSNEGFGRVLVEAGLQSLPVVATRIAGTEDIVADGETGFLHAPEDEAGMASAVLRLLYDPELRVRMGAAARARMRRLFDPEVLAAHWVDLLISVAEDRA